MKKFLVVSALVVFSLGGLSYSWTFTEYGRLDYAAAVFSKLASWNTAPTEMNANTREASRVLIKSMAGPIPYNNSVKFEDREILRFDGSFLPIRVYRPNKQGILPIYLHIHGGAWWMGDGYPVQNANSYLADRAGVIVVSVEYRLAPEFPFPHGLDDCLLALRWLHENGFQFGGDPERIAVGGGSAGGNLAAALTLVARDSAGPPISFQFLFVPATDISGTQKWSSYEETGDKYMLKVSEIERIIALYAPNPIDRLLAAASPLLATSHKGLPPALIVTAQFDPLRDQGEAYARRLESAGVPVVLHREKGAIHGLVGSDSRFISVYELAANSLRDHFSDP
jgi:acetyl esterase